VDSKTLVLFIICSLSTLILVCYFACLNSKIWN